MATESTSSKGRSDKEANPCVNQKTNTEIFVVKVKIVHCNIADKEHEGSIRQYAHTYHRNGNTICVCKEFYNLPPEHQDGLIAHEVGHLLHKGQDHSEQDADNAFKEKYGIRIKYKNSRYGKRLQFID